MIEDYVARHKTYTTANGVVYIRPLWPTSCGPWNAATSGSCLRMMLRYDVPACLDRAHGSEMQSLLARDGLQATSPLDLHPPNPSVHPLEVGP